MSALRAIAHPYVVRGRGAGGARAVIRGTHTPVRIVVGYYKLGYSADEILAGLPHLTPAQVYDCLSYYFDNQQQIEAELAASQDIESMLTSFGLKMDEGGRISRGV